MPNTTAEPMVMLNIFEVEPENAEALLEVMEALTEALRKEPNFISATFHVSLDRTKVFNYSTFQGSLEEHAAMLQKPEHQQQIQRCFALVKGNQRIFAHKAFVATQESFDRVEARLS